jgi:fido (protein-threonine AMPylation protein)
LQVCNCGSVRLEGTLPRKADLFGIVENAMSVQNPPRGRRGRPPRDEIYRRLDYQIQELWERMGGLPSPVEAAEIWRGIWFEEAHHSTAIEGNTLVLKQVEALLAEGRAVGDKELREYMEVRGYADAAEWVYRQAIQPGAWSNAELLTLTEVRQVHRQTMTPVWDVAPHPSANEHESPGNFRQHDIQPFPGGMAPVSWPVVEAEVRAWLAAVNELTPRTDDFPEAVAGLHSRFECIHPFLDGNGRTGRLILNLLLVRLGYPPVIIYKRQRTDYLRALRRADTGDPGSLGELLARAILDNLYKFVVPAVAGPARLVPLAALATSQISADALRVAAFRGRLQASRGPDGQWRSSRNWVDDYLGGRWQRDYP